MPAIFVTQAKATPLPYLFDCAFIANAASFLLPISNPANLVVYGAHMPSLGPWLAEFGIASVLSVLVPYLTLRFTQRAEIAGDIARDVEVPALSLGGRFAAGGIAGTAIVLLTASGLFWTPGAGGKIHHHMDPLAIASGV